ncbi:hypothetical protein [Sphingobacterium corticibacterium]|uniref:DUF4374 domain-containing protein n=1 Tax=Sphingobacterium corticibacterium TaxID=2484746 RepID=A0A4V2DBI5_9SPHI|nr:hypothetical protein [Sphingobacterium corticibacterium]RZF58108.1 hypothetical protein EWE74_18820 [Sphingobacterium corticibacterium]
MSKISPIYYVFAMLALILGFYACERDDAEPNLEMRKFTRLYVSFEEHTVGKNPPDTNIRVIYPADSSVFAFNGRHVSQVWGGGPIYYESQMNAIFQASVNRAGSNDTAIAVLNVGSSGSLNNAGLPKSRYYNSVRGMVYHARTNVLYVVNGAGPDAGVYVMERPRYANREKQPVKKLRNSSLAMWGAAYQNEKLFSSKTSSPGGIYVFEDIANTEVRESDSISVVPLSPTRILQIEGATNNVRGLFYDTVKNVMAVAQIGDGNAGNGRILIFENFSDLAAEEGTITPTRVITGANTGLISPVDVVIDTRETGVYLYVADRGARKISRFKYTDDGDIEPDKVINTSDFKDGRTPVSITLDTREHEQ